MEKIGLYVPGQTWPYKNAQEFTEVYYQLADSKDFKGCLELSMVGLTRIFNIMGDKIYLDECCSLCEVVVKCSNWVQNEELDKHFK